MSKPGIFVSYRRSDTVYFVRGQLRGALQQAFPDHEVFVDADIAAGAQFPEVIREKIGRSHVVIAVIGSGWITQRLESEADWVRLELEQAFAQGTRTVPLLLGVEMPAAGALPDSLRPLRACNALRITPDRLDDDLKGVIAKIGQALKEEAERARRRLVRVDSVELARHEALEHWRYIKERGLTEARLREHLALFPEDAVTVRMARDALAEWMVREASEPGRVDGPLGPEVWVPAGVLRSENWNEPQSVARFRMMVTPVTEAQWRSVVGRARGKRGEDCPVTLVSWGDAVGFCNALSDRAGVPRAYRIEGDTVQWDPRSEGYRLPTEREWEYACRAGTTTKWSWGDDASGADAHAWHNGNSNGRAHPVGTKVANPWGLHDLHGNVWEWCWTPWEKPAASHEPVTLVTTNTGPDRVFRGGSFHREPGILRSAGRSGYGPVHRSASLGFRCVSGSRPQT